MKSLIATKVKDGWYVKITETITVPRKDDIFKLARQEGLKVNKLLSKVSPKKLFAD